ncbi:MAG: DUF3892 domain-containing protein [Geodermatophilaceae bacterium]|nr:DUF3892 domain-containing protein [Geodermatophilaceae bacterium]
MADRLVTHVARDSSGDVLSIANPESTWFQRRREWAIRDIETGRHRYFVPGDGGPDRRIGVVHAPSGRYLRSFADEDPGNNLDTLPAHDRRPWEVAHDHAEVLAVHAALVPHGTQGQVLLLGGDEHDFDNAEAGDIFNTRIYDVATNTVLHIDSPEADAFCCGHAFLPDGRLLVGGGTESWRSQHMNAHMHTEAHWSGARDCAAYDNDGTWTALAPMLPEPGQTTRGGGRWYPTLLTLADGRILAVGGHPRVSDDQEVNDGRHGNWLPEIYDPAPTPGPIPTATGSTCSGPRWVRRRCHPGRHSVLSTATGTTRGSSCCPTGASSSPRPTTVSAGGTTRRPVCSTT